MAEFATIARPYAKALFDVAVQKDQAGTWLTGLQELAWASQQPSVMVMLNNTETSDIQKADELVRLLNESLPMKDEEFKNFVYVVAQYKRLEVLPEIYDQYQNLVLSHNNAQKAIIYSAYEFAGEGQKANIIQELERHFNTGLKATFVVDPELIGGIKVEVGDQVLDLSVQEKLKSLYVAMTN